MDSSRWDRIQSVFHGAADLPKLQQRAFLESACAGDISLIADVQALLDEDAKDSSLLNRNMADIASEVLDDPASEAMSAMLRLRSEESFASSSSRACTS